MNNQSLSLSPLQKAAACRMIKAQHQTGAVMIFSLLLLLVITMIGVSNIQTTTSQEKMIANLQNDRKTFQAAEDAIEKKINDIDYLNQSYLASLTSSTPTWPTSTVATASASNDFLASSTEAQFVGTSVPQGDYAGSIRMGAAGYTLYTYEMRGSANIENTNVSNTNVQGAYVLGVQIN